MKIRLIIFSLIITSNIYGQSFTFKDGDKIYTCAHVLDNITGQIDAFPCSSLKLILKRDSENEFIILNNDNKEIHYKIKDTFYIDEIKYFRTLSDNGIKTVFSILEDGSGVMRYMDVTFYSESYEKPYSYKMRVFNYSIYDSKEVERIEKLESKTYDLKEIDKKKWYKMLSLVQYDFFRYFEFYGGPKFDEKDKTKDYIFIDNIYKIKATGDYRKESIKTEINLLKGDELPGLSSHVFVDEIPYVKLEEGAGVYPEVNFPEIPVQYVQGVAIVKVKWANDIVEITKRSPPAGLDIEKILIEKMKDDHKGGLSLPNGNLSIKYTYIRVLGQYKITYNWFK